MKQLWFFQLWSASNADMIYGRPIAKCVRHWQQITSLFLAFGDIDFSHFKPKIITDYHCLVNCRQTYTNFDFF